MEEVICIIESHKNCFYFKVDSQKLNDENYIKSKYNEAVESISVKHNISKEMLKLKEITYIDDDFIKGLCHVFIQNTANNG